jgi:hypothetical protein
MSATRDELLPALETVLRITRQMAPVVKVKRSDLIHLAVNDFANRNEVRGILARMPDVSMAAVVFDSFGIDNIRLVVPTHIAEDPLTQVHRQFREDLAAIVAGAVTDELWGRIAEHGRIVAVVPPAAKGRRRTAPKLCLPTSLPSALAFVLSQLVKAGIGKDSDLRRCELPGCGRFFFSSEESPKGQGAPLKKFCKGHGEEYRRLTAKDRMAASREGITVEEYRARAARAGANKVRT